jgi:hypothetical protein
MARTIYVKSARARINKGTGEQQPLRTCEQCGKDIQIGSAYKHISIKTGPYSSQRRYRCGDCPTWQIWEYSNSLSARLAQIDHNLRNAVADVEDKDAAESAFSEAADAIRELADEKRDAAANIEDGFGHPTTQSEELTEQADSLTGWADEIESAELPDDPDPADGECETCEGTGEITEEGAQPVMQTCPECNGSGIPDTPTDDQITQWHEDLEQALSVLDNCPV